VIDGGEAVYLRIYPVSSDGVDSWKLDGPAPPRLIVVYH
jgi:hypothetical protein